MRSFNHKGSLFLAAIKGLVCFLAKGVNISYCTPLKFNKVSLLFSRGRTHDLFDWWNHVILCVGFLYFGISSSFFFFSRCSSILCCFRCAAPAIGHGAQQAKLLSVTTQCLKCKENTMGWLNNKNED